MMQAQAEPVDERLQFLKLLFSDGECIDVRLICDDEESERRRHPVNSLDEALKLIAKWDGERNVFVGVAARRSGVRAEGAGGLKNLEHVRVLWADLDCKVDGEREVFLDAINEFPHPPSLLVDSGGGFHAYWLLEESYALKEKDARDELQNTLKGIADVLGGDRAVTNPSHPMRVPGTMNILDAKKIAAGRKPAPCTIIEAHENRVYPFDDFADFTTRGEELSSKAEPVNYESPTWDGKLPPTVDELLHGDGERGSELRDSAWTPKPDGDASEEDWRCVMLLLEAGVSPQDVEAALRYRRKYFALKPKHDRYFPDTVSKALGVRKATPPAVQDRNATEFLPYLELGSRPTPPYPLHALPSTLSGWATTVAENGELPVDIPAVLGFASVASAAMRGYAVEIPGGHVEELCTYVAVLAEPGARKTFAMNQARAPHLEWEVDHRDEALDCIVKHQAEADTRDLALKAEQRRFKGALDDPIKRQEAEDALLAIQEAKAHHSRKKPVIPRLVVDDATPEALGVTMEEQGGCIAIFAAEGSDLFAQYGAKGGRYADTPTLTLMAEGWNGQPYRVDRLGRDPVHIDNARLSVATTLQPAMLDRVKEDEGLRNAGIFARFLYTKPESTLGRRTHDAPQLDRLCIQQYKQLVRKLLDAKTEEPGERQHLQLTREAETIRQQFSREVEATMRVDGSTEYLKDFASKIQGYVTRFAGVLHVAANACGIDRGEKQIEAKTMENAATLARYHLEHVIAIFGGSAHPDMAKAEKVWRWLKKKAGSGEPVEDRAIVNGTKGGVLSKREDWLAAYTLLESSGHIARVDPSSSRKNPDIAVNPEALRRN